MFKHLILGLVLTLTGCVVADMDSTNHTAFPYAQTFQKPATLGHTDRAQRRADLYACGVNKNLDVDRKIWLRGQLYPGETIEQMMTRVESVESCMKGKGYEVLGFNQCGPLKAPTGKCN
jgi:hypothetical protein